MAFRDLPREALRPVASASGSQDRSLRVAELTREQAKRARLEQARERQLADVRTRPEDSAPAIRRMLGYDGPSREPRRWERAVGWRPDGTYGPTDVQVGDGAPGVLRLGSTRSDR